MCFRTESRMRAADVIEIDIDAARARGREPRVERAGLIVDARIEPEFVHDVITFRASACDTNCSTAFELRELANHAADRTACCRYNHGFTRLWPAMLVEPYPSGHAGHADSA
jgi:hypothetical protein